MRNSSFGTRSATFALMGALAVAPGCFFGGCAEDDCGCPADLGECAIPTCVDGECVVDFAEGTASSDTTGDCQILVCTGSDEDPVPQPDGMDVPNDLNECTTDACGPNGPVFEPVAAGTLCSGGSCTASGICSPCSDGNSCTTDDCSSGAVVSTPLPVGTACDQGGFCDASAMCLACDDGNACTTDDCSTGTPVHTDLPEGAACMSGNENGVCNNHICATWCQPLPTAGSCVDNGAYEGTDDSPLGKPQFEDDDDAPRPICGVLQPGDEDWISYYAEDESFENDVNDFEVWSFGSQLRFCAFAECDVGTTEAPCYNEGIPTTGPNGEPGCCWTGVFQELIYRSMNLDCIGTSEDSGWVRVRFDNPSTDCVPYALLDYGY